MASLFCGHYELVDADANVGIVLRDAFSSELSPNDEEEMGALK